MDLEETQRLFTKEYPVLFAFAYRFVRYRIPQREDAEDVVANVLTQAYHALGQFDATRGNLTQWISGIARHAVQMHWRSHKPTIALDDIIDTLPDLSTTTVADLEHRLTIDRIIRGLPPETKALLAMRYEDDMTYAEIAEAVGKDAAAIRKWFSRLHEKLRLTYQETDIC